MGDARRGDRDDRRQRSGSVVIAVDGCTRQLSCAYLLHTYLVYPKSPHRYIPTVPASDHRICTVPLPPTTYCAASPYHRLCRFPHPCATVSCPETSYAVAPATCLLPATASPSPPTPLQCL